MSGKEILVDTNIILYLLDGSNTLEYLLQGKSIYLSFITELELVGFQASKKEEQKIASLLNDCTIIQMTNTIKGKYIELRKKYRLKLADAMIAATALTFDLPLTTADKHFQIVKELDLIAYQHGND